MSFFRDISISSKILIPPAIMVAALGVVLLFAIYGLDKQSAALRQMHEIALDRTTLVNEFISMSERVQSDVFRISVLRFMRLPDTETQPIHGHLEQGLVNLRVVYGQFLSKWPLDQKEKEILEQMKVPMDAFSQQAQQAVAAVSENPSFGILLVRSATVPFTEFRRRLTEFLNYQKEKIVQAEIISRQTVNTIKTTTIAVALFMAFIAIFFTMIIGTRFISRPVRSMTEVMGQLAGGDLSVDVGDLTRKDEIGAMAKAVEEFRKNAIERRAAEEALRKSQLLLNAVGRMGKIGGWEFDVETLEQVWTEEVYRIHEVDLDYNPTVGKGIDFYAPESRPIIEQAVQRAIDDGEPFDVELRFITAKGNHLWVHAFGQAHKKNGEPTKIWGVFQDITERKLAEERIKASLQEKEVLLREIHHRVKNNMQVITSLLRLQSDTIKDQQYAEMLKESQERIKSMALIHEKLYQSKDLSRVDFNEYMNSLMTGLFRSYGVDPGRIASKLEVEDISLGLDHAIPCGLIINELVSNSLKYAFPEDRKGEIGVTLRLNSKDEIELRVSDNGIGIPEDLDIRNTDSVGLELVTILAEDQLEGKIDLDRTGGTTFRILFKGQI